MNQQHFSHQFRKLVRDDFLRHNILFFIGSGLVAFFNYLFYPVLGHMLPTSDFGEVQTITSIYLQVILLMIVLTNVSVNAAVNSQSVRQKNTIILEFARLATWTMIAIVVTGMIFSRALQHYLHFDSLWPFGLLGITLIIGADQVLRAAYFRSQQAYGKLSLNNFLSASLKLVAAIVFVAIGWGALGAIGGLIVGQIAAYCYALAATRRATIVGKQRRFYLPRWEIVKPHLGYAGFVFAISIAGTIFVSCDIIFVKHYFSAAIVGQYAGLTTAARIIYFLTNSIGIVLLSAVQLDAPAGHNRRLLVRSIGLTILIGGSVWVSFCLAPDFFLRLLVGDNYRQFSSLLPWLGLTMLLLSVLEVIFTYDIALHRWKSAYTAGAGLAITFLLIGHHHQSPQQIVAALTLGVVVTITARLLLSLWPIFSGAKPSQGVE